MNRDSKVDAKGHIKRENESKQRQIEKKQEGQGKDQSLSELE